MKSRCLTLIFIVLSSVFLAGCNRVKNTASSINVYQGYPCDARCGDFQTGYDAAKAQQITTNTRCDTLHETSRLGCLAYVQDYRVEHEHDGGYIFPVN